MTEIEQLTTKQIVQKTFDAIDEVKESLNREAASKQANKTATPAMTEARALGLCVDALQSLKDEERRNASTTFEGLAVDWPAGSRILQFLAHRFGVRLVEIREQPCGRLHLEEANTTALVEALRNPQL